MKHHFKCTMETTALELWSRQATAVYMSRSHLSDFISIVHESALSDMLVN